MPGVSTAVHAHNTHHQSSTCWRWSLRTFAGLSARPLPPSAPPYPSGQKTSSHVSQQSTKTMTVSTVSTHSQFSWPPDLFQQLYWNMFSYLLCETVMRLKSCFNCVISEKWSIKSLNDNNPPVLPTLMKGILERRHECHLQYWGSGCDWAERDNSVPERSILGTVSI